MIMDIGDPRVPHERPLPTLGSSQPLEGREVLNFESGLKEESDSAHQTSRKASQERGMAQVQAQRQVLESMAHAQGMCNIEVTGKATGGCGNIMASLTLESKLRGSFCRKGYWVENWGQSILNPMPSFDKEDS